MSKSCYQGLSLRDQGQGQDFFLKAKAKAKDIKIFQGQGQDFSLKPRPRPEVSRPRPRPMPRPCHPRPRPRPRFPRGSSRPRPGLDDNKTGMSESLDFAHVLFDIQILILRLPSSAPSKVYEIWPQAELVNSLSYYTKSSSKFYREGVKSAKFGLDFQLQSPLTHSGIEIHCRATDQKSKNSF